MELIRGLHNLRPRHRGCIATIGNYDGVHLGHQAVLAQLARKGKELGLPSLALIFEPMPREFFAGPQAPPRIASLREKLEDLAAAGAERVLCVRFDAAFAQMTPREFIDRILLHGLGVRYLVVGSDFRFGHRREGDFALLQSAAAAHGFVVESLAPFCIDGERVSSSRIRAALAAGDMDQAQRLLGRSCRISGRVAGGRKLGRELGVPTANLPVRERRAIRYGVYAARASGAGATGMAAAVSLGTRPTVAGEDCLLEVHLLDFDGDVYGQRLDVQLLKFLRPEERFSGLEALKQQMREDIRQVRAWLQGQK